MRSPEESIASIILGPVRTRPPGILAGAVLATVVFHGAAGVLAWRAWPSRPPPAPRAEPKPSIKVEHVVDLQPPAPPAPPPPAPPPAPAPRVARAPAPAKAPPRDTPPSPPPEPAQAAAVVAVDAAEAPLDFTGFDIVSGSAERYAGGVTASNGRSTKAVAGSAAEATGPATPGRARSVQLPARNWSCPWPREADALRIDEQTVVLRVVVTPEGRVTSAELLSDPGHGFGQAALACAREVRFDAALDAEGRPYLATSPPIRVRFTRG
ncbi:energy transducer TonB [Cystobacter fuscus]|uniref:energy transducer TonB family protein n=1 Tax=Cystobacter fuscus TaxID=43 RepID=UPI002B283147|nr:energy transducer TonB [Cystobacter fuscus]